MGPFLYSKFMKVTIEVEFNTKEEDASKIDIALMRGIYMGLDIRNIAAPHDIQNVDIKHIKENDNG